MEEAGNEVADGEEAGNEVAGVEVADNEVDGNEVKILRESDILAKVI